MNVRVEKKKKLRARYHVKAMLVTMWCGEGSPRNAKKILGAQGPDRCLGRLTAMASRAPLPDFSTTAVGPGLNFPCRSSKAYSLR